MEGNLNLNSLHKKEGETKMERLWKFIKDEDGLETPEYAVMGALIVVGLVATVILLRGSIIQTFSDMTSAIGSR
jgi:Flp pilus assembly pilin Flp